MEIFRSCPDVLRGRRRKCDLKGQLEMPAYGSPLFTFSTVVQACDDMLGAGGTWPRQTDRACLWCTEKFPWVPVGVPRAYNERKDKFTLKWAFCSFNCAKAYMCDKGMKTDLLFYMAQRLFGSGHEISERLSGIREAPPREALRTFGGPLDIDQFRATPLRIRHGHPLDINVKCDPQLLALAGAGGREQAMAQTSRTSNLLDTVARPPPPRAGSTVTQMMRSTAAPKRAPPPKRGLDAFLKPTGAPAAEQLAASHANRTGKRPRTGARAAASAGGGDQI